VSEQLQRFGYFVVETNDIAAASYQEIRLEVIKVFNKITVRTGILENILSADKTCIPSSEYLFFCPSM
jgi:hypothetical protein